MERILVVDDEEKITHVIRAYLEKEGFAVETAADGMHALQLAQNRDYALIVLDLMLPGLSGEEVTKRLRRAGNAVPIIMLTAKGAEEEKILGLGLGADDYIVKPFSPGELVARVMAVLRRARNTPGLLLADVLDFADGRLVIDTLRHEVIIDGQKIEQTATDYKLLVALAKNAGRVFSRSELMDIVQGVYATGFDRTIDSHIKNLRQKLEPHPERPRFIRTVYGVGYKFVGD